MNCLFGIVYQGDYQAKKFDFYRIMFQNLKVKFASQIVFISLM